MLLHAGGQHVCSWLVSYINMSATDTADVKPLDQSASSALRARDRPASSALRARHRPASSALRARDRPAAAVLKRKPARRFSDEDAAEKGSVRDDAAGLIALGTKTFCVESTAAREVAMACRGLRGLMAKKRLW